MSETFQSLKSEIISLHARRKYAGPLERRLVALRTNELRKEIRMDKREQSLVNQMATCLLDRGADLGCERACMMELQRAEYRGGDIATLVDRAVEEARVRRAAWATSKDIA